jgi:hypothetical protein
VLAEALVATARARADARDRAVRRAYQQAQAARAGICRLLETAPLDPEGLAVIRAVLDGRERQLRAQAAARLAEQPAAGGAGDRRRLGTGWLERYRVAGRWGPYLRARWREAGRKHMRYIGKAPE